jgi:cation diffusion facilitator family transporter
MGCQGSRRKNPSGHGKAEYFSSGLEGGLIIIAAAAIAYTAVNRLLHPQPLEQIGVGLGVSVIASIINFIVARILFRAAKQHNSIALEADSRHLMADVWTSVGILAGVGAVGLTGWVWLDSVVALAVSVHIVWAGSALVRRSIDGLMDAGLPKEDLEKIEQVMDRYRAHNILFHALRTRRAASQRFISVHMLVPGEMTVHDAHHMAADFERDLHALLDQATITTHIEPIEDKNAFH